MQWFWSPKNEVWHCFHCFPIYLPWNDGTGCHDLSFLNEKPTFSLSSFTFIKRLFSSSSLSAIRVVILFPTCVSSSPAFLMMCSAYKLNKQGDNIQPWCTPFPIWKQSVVPCPGDILSWLQNFIFLEVANCPSRIDSDHEEFRLRYRLFGQVT